MYCGGILYLGPERWGAFEGELVVTGGINELAGAKKTQQASLLRVSAQLTALEASSNLLRENGTLQSSTQLGGTDTLQK